MNLDAFQCQSCKVKLQFTWTDSSAAALRNAVPNKQRYGSAAANSTGGLSKIDESFIILDDAVSGRKGYAAAEPTTTSGPSRNMEESFVLLAPSSTAKPGQAAPPSQPPSGASATFQALTKIFEVASGETQVEQPICRECATRLREEFDKQTAEAEQELERYEAALKRLQEDTREPMSHRQFDSELQQAELELEQERQAVARLTAELGDAERELQRLQLTSKDLGALEERYWHDFNEFQWQLRCHVEERDAMLTRIEHATAQLEALRRTNVYNDVFYIWYDGPFGTISGFRLGRTPAIPVEWDEINAAWGQAVLLLHTMAQAFKLQFSQYRLLPMGSYPRISDRKTTYELHGPVNKYLCATYDRAMVCFITCLKEFSEFAQSKDIANGRAEVFDPPYTIDGDKVGGLTIRLMFNQDAKWTKALKYMLTHLKWCLKWMNSNPQYQM